MSSVYPLPNINYPLNRWTVLNSIYETHEMSKISSLLKSITGQSYCSLVNHKECRYEYFPPHYAVHTSPGEGRESRLLMEVRRYAD